MNRFDENKFDNDLKKASKEFDIEIPEVLKNSILDTLDNLPEKRCEKKKSYKKVSSFGGLILCGLLVFNIVFPVYAEKLPIIGPTFKSINDSIGYGGKYVDSAKDIELIQKYKDKTMTIKNIYFDGVELAIAYEIKSESGFDKKPVIFPIIKKGLKKIDSHSEINSGEFVDDNTYVGLASCVFESSVIDDKGKISYIVNDIYGDWVGEYPERFKFKLELDSESMGKSIYNVNKDIKYNGSSFKIKDVVISKFNTIVYYDSNVEIVNDERNKSMAKYDLIFKAIDDKGMPIDFKKGGGDGFWTSKYTTAETKKYWRFGEVDKDAKFITIIPIITDWSINEEINYIINKEGKTEIKLENGKEYIIEKIDFLEDKTIIDITLRDYPSRVDSTELYFLDEENNYIHPESTKFNGIDNGYKYTLTLPKLDSSKDYFLPLTPNRNITLEEEKTIINMDDIKN